MPTRRAVPPSYPGLPRLAAVAEAAARFERLALDDLESLGGVDAAVPCADRRGRSREEVLAAWVRGWSAPGADAGLWPDGWRRADVGVDGGRYVFTADSGETVKVARHALGREANRREASLWAGAPPALAAWLAPVLAADPRGGWLVMAATQPAGRANVPPASALPAGLVAAVGDLGMYTRWGFSGERPVLVNYGSAPCPAPTPGGALARFFAGAA